MFRFSWIIALGTVLAACGGDTDSATDTSSSSDQGAVLSDSASPEEDTFVFVDTGPGEPCDPEKLVNAPPQRTGDCENPSWPTCAGYEWPEYVLEDFQPASDRLGEVYGRDGFTGHVTFVSFLTASCYFCQIQAEKMEEMMKLFEWEGMDVRFVAINASSNAAASVQKKLIYMINDSGEQEVDEDGNPVHRCTFPLLQDTDEVDAWGAHDAHKAEIYIYGSDGNLLEYYAASEEVKTALGDDEGYQNMVKVVRRAWCNEQ
jgi:hypothetical protein